MSTLQTLFPELYTRLSSLSPEQLPQFLLHFVPGIVFGMALTIGTAFGRDLLVSYLTTYSQTDRNHSGTALWLIRGLSAIGGWFIWLAGVYAAVQIMPFMEAIDHPAQKLFTLAIYLQLGIIASRLLQKWTEDYTREHRKTEAARVTMVTSVVRVGYLLIWILALILVLDNFGVDVTAMVAGLGVGGIAVAFAFQNILKDIFGSFSIVFDKPFVMGDFISAGEHMGTVEEIGTKTTRLRSLSGELIVISNNDLLSSRIRNFGNMQERRVVFTIRVQYGTPAAKVEKIPTMIRNMLEKYEDIRFDRSHFQQFTDYGLQFETVYIVLVPDFGRMMDIQQEVNLNLYRTFEKEGIRFAVPIQNMLSTLEDAEARLAEKPSLSKRINTPKSATKKR